MNVPLIIEILAYEKISGNSLNGSGPMGFWGKVMVMAAPSTIPWTGAVMALGNFVTVVRLKR